MPKTRLQKLIFSVLMALIMVYGMETYNHFIAGIRGFSAFELPIIELLGLMAIVILFQELFAGKLARFIAFRFIKSHQKLDGKNNFKLILAIQIATVCIMCPLMSLVATFIFKSEIPAPFVQKWLMTLAINLPFAMLWQIFAAGPAVRKVVSFIKR